MTQTLTATPAYAPPGKPLCGHCGTDRHDDFRILSRHRTSVGTTVWIRCSCGTPQVRVATGAGIQLVARGRLPQGRGPGPGR